MAQARVGIDVGGTFTDAVLVDSDNRLHIGKVASTPSDISVGFVRGLDVLEERSGIAAGELTYLAHGTTVATNAIVQRRLARSGLITNDGFRDLLEIGTQQRAHIYDLWTPEQPAVISREHCHGVRGRIAPDGSELQPLSEDDVRAAAAALREAGAESVAVVLLFSFLNPAHERRVRRILAAELPGVPVTLSCEVAPEIREYLRASTTALNASLLPLVGSYLGRLAEVVAARGVAVPVHLMCSNGGLAAARAAAELPVALATSGPAAGVIGAARLGALAGESDLLTFDMGGTTADVAVVIDGRPEVRHSGVLNGHPVNLSQLDVLCVGAGGGSLARVDEFGALLVGPQSAGASPGPAAYGRGGVHPTVTDAHAVLGTLSESRSLGGDLTIDPEAARAAVQREVAGPLGLSVEDAAWAILRVANANMAAALRLVSVARGHDPRRMALVALGGAGPMHGCALAEELDVPRLLVPPYPGVTAALGLLLSDIRYDIGQSWVRETGRVGEAALEEQLAALTARARELLAQTGHEEDGQLEFSADMRYLGQAYNLTVPLPPPPVTAGSTAEAERSFVEAHRKAYDYVLPDTPTEIVALRVRAVVPAEPVVWEVAGAGRDDAFLGRRKVHMNGEWLECDVLDRARLGTGDLVHGPAIIDQEDTTTVVLPGWQAETVAAGSLLLTRRDHA